MYEVNLMIDEDLVKQVIAQDRKAQKQLYDNYAPAMLGVCYRYLGSREDAEEALQIGFIKVFNHIKSYRNDGSFEGWIRKIIVNTSLNLLKQKKRLIWENYDAQEIVFNEYFDEQIDTRVLMKHIAELPAGYRTILNMYAIEGYSHKEISELLEINESTSRSQFARAKKLLAATLKLNTNFAKHE